MSLAAGQKSLVQPVHSNMHVTTRNTRFYPLLRPLGTSKESQAAGLAKAEKICSKQ